MSNRKNSKKQTIENLLNWIAIISCLLCIALVLFLSIRVAIQLFRTHPYQDGVEKFNATAKEHIVYYVSKEEEDFYLNFSEEKDGKFLLQPANPNWIQEGLGLVDKNNPQYQKACKFSAIIANKFLGEEDIAELKMLGAALYGGKHTEEQEAYIENYIDTALICAKDPLEIQLYNLFN